MASNDFDVSNMLAQIDLGFVLQDWKKCLPYLNLGLGKWEYKPNVEDCISLFYNREIVKHEKKLYIVKVIVSTFEIISIVVEEEGKSICKYQSHFKDVDEVKFHIRLESLKINPFL